MTFDAFDVVVVPFPFTDGPTHRRRPAVILSGSSFGSEAAHSVFAMITSARQSSWPLDVPVSDLATAGLKVPCLVRMKLFTLDHRLVIERKGRLAADDTLQVQDAVRRLFCQEPSLSDTLGGISPDNIHPEM